MVDVCMLSDSHACFHRSDNCFQLLVSQFAEIFEGGFIAPFNFVKVRCCMLLDRNAVCLRTLFVHFCMCAFDYQPNHSIGN